MRADRPHVQHQRLLLSELRSAVFEAVPLLAHHATCCCRWCLCRLGKKVAEAEEAVLAKRELDNVIADLRRQLAASQEEVVTLQVDGWDGVGGAGLGRKAWRHQLYH